MVRAKRVSAPTTTAPADSTESGDSERAHLAVRWVWPDPAGGVVILPKGRLLLGRGEDCDFALPGRETSRHHGEIVADGPIHVLRDLGSRNGVFIDGEKIAEGVLKEGTVIRLGEWVGLVSRVHAHVAAQAPSFQQVSEAFFAGPVLGPVVDLTRRAAASELPVVICGETGTGKERLAEALHTFSGRRGPFLAVNCAALPESLAEAELFGYRKGAFTGAERNAPGHFRAADGGTLLLDEITDLSAPVQAKLLRALEQREVIPLGESSPVRIVAATQEPLAIAVEERRFRMDLAARLDGVTITLPPLRERICEVPYLFRELLRVHGGGRAPDVEARLVEQLCLYDWPCNVRELDLLVRRLLTLHSHEPPLKRAHLPERFFAKPSASIHPASPSASSAQGVDADALTRALRAHRGNVARAAAALGISRQRAYRIIEARPEIDLDAIRAT
jgi:transcriptional regulator with PAS, ATPase and Fis domain